MRLLIQGGRLIDPGNQIDELMDIVIQHGKIQDLQPAAVRRSPREWAEFQIIPAAGLVVTPGLIDMHTHLREPGYEYKETIRTAVQSAVAGGFGAVACMANTRPVNDNRSVCDYIINRAREARLARVFPIGAISVGLAGETLAEYGELKESGAVGVSDDGNPVMNSQLMRRAMEYAKAFGLPVISHCEDLHLSQKGVMNEGVTSTRLGLRGIPAAAEEVMVQRDILLCQLTENPLHIAHVSTAGSVQMVREARKRGLPVTAETAPHYFTLTEEAVVGFDTLAKVNPPLRTRGDLLAIQKGLKDGTIEAIASDHAPHSLLEKEVEFDQAASGLVGLETALPLTLQLVHQGILTWPQAVSKLSLGPANILGLTEWGRVRVQGPAHLTLIDPDREYTVEVQRFRSLSKNSPFNGLRLKGKAVMTIIDGRIVYNRLSPGREGT